MVAAKCWKFGIRILTSWVWLKLLISFEDIHLWEFGLSNINWQSTCEICNKFKPLCQNSTKILSISCFLLYIIAIFLLLELISELLSLWLSCCCCCCCCWRAWAFLVKKSIALSTNWVWVNLFCLYSRLDLRSGWVDLRRHHKYAKLLMLLSESLAIILRNTTGEKAGMYSLGTDPFLFILVLWDGSEVEMVRSWVYR